MLTDTLQTALFNEPADHRPVHVIGIGDAGCRITSEIWRRKIRGVGVTCIDTDAMSLDRSFADGTMLLGAATMHGFGSGGDSKAVARAVVERSAAIGELVSGATCVLVIAGLAGGTGSGAAPAIAEVVRSSGVLTVGISIAPLEFEPILTHIAAAESLERFKVSCDGVFEITGHTRDRSQQGPVEVDVTLHRIFSEERSCAAAFVGTISTIVNAGPDRCDANPGDLRAILRDGLSAVFGSGTGFGHTGAAEATQTCLDAALTSSGQDRGIERAVVLIESGPDISVSHIATVTSLIESRIGSDTELHTAVRRTRLLGSNIRVSIIGCQRDIKRPAVVGPLRTARLLKFEPAEADRAANPRFATRLATSK